VTSAAVAAAAPIPISNWFPGLGDLSAGLVPGIRSSLAGDPSDRGLEAVHVLLIEDDPAIADMYRVQLEFDGFRVTVATTGEIGYTNVVSGRPDIVLLDLLLPDRSGLEIMSDIKEKLPTHAPVVILSNYGEPSMMDRGFSLGALEYLVKSRVTPASVSQSIRGWIEQARRERPDPAN
jgi:DNA-binding response OmpR family regulator